jgi:hypothetical protein
MENITSVVALKNAIIVLEVEQEIKGRLLKEQFHTTYESFKPASLIKTTLKDITSSPYLIENILVTVLGLASGYISRKINVGTSGNIFKNIIGSVLQFGITNLVAQHPEAVTSLGQSIFQKFKAGREDKLKNRELLASQTLLE